MHIYIFTYLHLHLHQDQCYIRYFVINFQLVLENDENVTIRHFLCGGNEPNNKLQLPKKGKITIGCNNTQ